MTKADLIDVIAVKAKTTRVRAESLVNAVFDAMAEGLMRNERIELRGFGTFTNRQYEAYRGRNPRTGELIDVAAKRLPHFTVGKDLLKKVNSERDQS